MRSTAGFNPAPAPLAGPDFVRMAAPPLAAGHGGAGCQPKIKINFSVIPNGPGQPVIRSGCLQPARERGIGG